MLGNLQMLLHLEQLHPIQIHHNGNQENRKKCKLVQKWSPPPSVKLGGCSRYSEWQMWSICYMQFELYYISCVGSTFLTLWKHSLTETTQPSGLERVVWITPKASPSAQKQCLHWTCFLKEVTRKCLMFKWLEIQLIIYIYTHTCVYMSVCVYIVCISSDSHKSCMRVQFSPHLPQFLVGSVLFILVTLRGV